MKSLFGCVAAAILALASAASAQNYQPYSNPYDPNSATNPYATNPPMIFDEDGNYRGRLSTNPYLPDSTSNPYGRYGSPYSPDSINNPYGAGNPYSQKKLIIIPPQ